MYWQMVIRRHSTQLDVLTVQVLSSVQVLLVLTTEVLMYTCLRQIIFFGYVYQKHT